MKRWRNNTPSLLEGYDISEIPGCNPFATITLKNCGLDPEFNFLQAPECECGCGGKANIILHDNDEVLDFCEMMCWENDECNYCGVFAVTEDELLLLAIKTEDGTGTFMRKYTDPESIGEIIAELGLHCYGLIVYDRNGSYRIVES